MSFDPVVLTVCLFTIGTTILTWCFTMRVMSVDSWRTLSYSRWLVLAVYVDSYLFVISTSILQAGIGLTSKLASCEAAIFMCIFFYCSSKVILYLFLIERVHIVRGRTKTRFNDKLYLFNLGGLIPYCIIVVLAIIFRVNELKDGGRCVIGLKRESSFLLLIYDLVINVYLTLQFLLPILGLYSFQHAPNTRLRNVAQRTCVGTVATLASSIANVSAVFALKGLEPAFICLSCCTVDVAFSAVVLHWVTSVQEDGGGQIGYGGCAFHARNSALCCVRPNTRNGTTRGTQKGTRHGTQAYIGTKASQHDMSVPGVNYANTVVTEVNCGPTDRRADGKGIISKAKQFAGRFSRGGGGGGGHTRTGSNDQPGRTSAEEIEMANVGENNEIVVSYDVWRTVEDKDPEQSNESEVSL